MGITVRRATPKDAAAFARHPEWADLLGTT